MSQRNKVKITVLKRQDPKDIFDEYPVNEKSWMVPCGVYTDGQEFILERFSMPEGFCASAWQSIYDKVQTVMYGGDFPYFDEKGVAVTCCTDGMRPVIFKVERI